MSISPKMTRIKFLGLGFVLFAFVLVSSCATSGFGLSKKTDDSRSMLYGYIEMDGSTLSLDSVSLIGTSQSGSFVEKTAMVKKGGFFFFYDLEPGIYALSGMKSQSTTVTLSNKDRLKKDHLSLDAATVLYYGKLKMKTKQDGTHSMGLTLEVAMEPEEAVAIKQLKGFFAKTPWEGLIDSRASSL